MTVKFRLELLEPTFVQGTDIVDRVYWLLTGRDSETEREQSAQGSVKLKDLPPPDGEYTPFQNLTKKQVLDWVKKDPGIETYKARIAKILREPDPMLAAAEEEATAVKPTWPWEDDAAA